MGGGKSRKQFRGQDSERSGNMQHRNGTGSLKSPSSRSFSKRYSVDESDYDGNSMCRVGETIPSNHYSSFSNKHSVGESEPGGRTSNSGTNAIIRQNVRSPSPLSDFSGSSNKQHGTGKDGRGNSGYDFDTMNHAVPRISNPPTRHQRSSLRPPRSPSVSPPLSPTSSPPSNRYPDHHSVQSDLTDLSSVNRRVTFGQNSSFSHREQHTRKMIGHQQQLKALTEEGGGSTSGSGSMNNSIHNKYSMDTDALLSQVESAMSGNQEMNRLY